MKYDVVVIGAGVSGLTAALVLAQQGRRVAILEKSTHTGSLLRRFKRGKVWCDPGLHYTGGFEENGSLSVLFKYLKMGDLKPSPMDPNAFDILFWKDREVRIPTGPENIIEALSSQFPSDRVAIRSYIEGVEHLMNTTPFVGFEMDADALRNSSKNTETFDGFMQRVGASEELTRMLAQYGYYLYGVHGCEVPFSLHAVTLGTFFRSASTLPFGGDSVIDSYIRRAQEENIDIFHSMPATGLKVNENRTLQGVLTEGELFECDSCISTMHPTLLADILPVKATRPAYLSRLREMENTNPCFAVYMDVDEIPEKITKTNRFKLDLTTSDLGANSLAIMACDSKNSPDKKKALCILKESGATPISKEDYIAKHKSNAYKEYKEKETNVIMEELEALFPELKGKYSVVNSATPYTYESYTGTPDGSMYGVKHSVQQISLSSMTSIKGLYLGGQSILMPGLIGAAISGFLSAGNIIGIEPLWKSVQECYRGK